MASPFGYNILSETPGQWEHLARLQPGALLFLNDTAGAAKAVGLFPKCQVISRIFRSDESTMHRTPGAVLSYLQARALEVSPSVIVNTQCEPDISRTDDLARLNDEHLKALQWAQPRGIRVGAMHLAHYGIDGGRWRELDPVVDYIAEYPNQFTLLCDEYAAGHAFSGVVDPRLTSGNEVGHIPVHTWVASPVPYYYHVGRITNYFRDRLQRGLKLPTTVISEFGLDALGDVTAWRNSLIRTPGYDDIRGWRSLREQHKAWYQALGWSAERAYAEMFIAAWKAIYTPFPNIVAALFYCRGTNNDRQWDQFRTDGALEFEQRLEAFQIGGGKPVEPTNKGAPELSWVNANPSINVRSTQSAASTANVVGSLANGTQVNEYKATRTPEKVNDKLWTWIEKADGSLKGWMALVWPKWEDQYTPVVAPPVDPPPPPPVDPPPPPPVDPPPVEPPPLALPFLTLDEAKQYVALMREIREADIAIRLATSKRIEAETKTIALWDAVLDRAIVDSGQAQAAPVIMPITFTAQAAPVEAEAVTPPTTELPITPTIDSTEDKIA
jgi:hypothetical protein